MVSENFNIQISNSALLSFLTGKSVGEKNSSKVVGTDLEDTTKNTELSAHLQLGCATASPALEFPWN